jgi:large subunit ribosomal protein L23
MFKVVGIVSKIEAKKAVESTFGVRVIGVNSLGLPGKVVRRGRQVGQRQSRRHLIVRVAKGESIDLGKTL